MGSALRTPYEQNGPDRRWRVDQGLGDNLLGQVITMDHSISRTTDTTPTTPRWSVTTDRWEPDADGQDWFFYGGGHTTEAADNSGSVLIEAQRNIRRENDGSEVHTDTVALLTTGEPYLSVTEARGVAHELVTASRTLEDETTVWQEPGEWNVDIDGSRTRFAYGLSFEVEGHDGDLSARMEKFEHQPGPAGGGTRTTYLIATGTDAAFTADQARQIADELIRYAALLDATTESDRAVER